MTVANLKVADHMFVSTKSNRGAGTPGAQIDVVNAETTQHVSMAGANSVTLSVDIHAVGLGANESVEVLLEQSNDRSNWFTVAATSGQPPQTAVGASLPYQYGNNVGMAWVRVVFLLDGPAQPITGNATVSCTLSTTLL